MNENAKSSITALRKNSSAATIASAQPAAAITMGLNSAKFKIEELDEAEREELD